MLDIYKEVNPCHFRKKADSFGRFHVLMEQIHSGAVMQFIFRLVPGHVPKQVHSGFFGSHPFFIQIEKITKKFEL